MPLLNEEAYLQKRIEGWRMLEDLCRMSEGRAAMTGHQVVQFVRLYRKTAGDLAYLTTHSTNTEVVDYLNALVARCYSQIYRSGRKSFWQGVWDAIQTGAMSVYRHRIFVFAAIAIFMGGFLMNAAILLALPGQRDALVPPQMRDSFDGWIRGVLPDRTAGEGVMATAFYASNNPRVGITAAVLGPLTAGIGSVYVTWTNGSLIGVLSVETAESGTIGFLYSSIYPHGVPEIGGIFIAAGAGLLVGWTILVPGKRTRALALKEAGLDAFRMLLVALIMIFAAAPIEGFFSFNNAVPQWAKVVFGTVGLIGVILFFRILGRGGLERLAAAEKANVKGLSGKG